MLTRHHFVVVILLAVMTIQGGMAFGQFGGLLDKAKKALDKQEHKNDSQQNPQPPATQPQQLLPDQQPQPSQPTQPTIPPTVTPPSSSQQVSQPISTQPQPNAIPSAPVDPMKIFEEKMAKQLKLQDANEQAQIDASHKLLEGAPVGDSISGYKTLKWGKYDLKTLVVVPVKKPGELILLQSVDKPTDYDWTKLRLQSVESPSLLPDPIQKYEYNLHYFYTADTNAVIGLVDDDKKIYTVEIPVNSIDIRSAIEIPYIPIGDMQFMLQQDAGNKGFRNFPNMISMAYDRNMLLQPVSQPADVRQDIINVAHDPSMLSMILTKYEKIDDENEIHYIAFMAEEKKDKFIIQRTLIFINQHLTTVRSSYKFINEQEDQSAGSKVIIDTMQEKYGMPTVKLEGNIFRIEWIKDDVSLVARVRGAAINTFEAESGKEAKTDVWKVVSKGNDVILMDISIANNAVFNKVMTEVKTRAQAKAKLAEEKKNNDLKKDLDGGL